MKKAKFQLDKLITAIFLCEGVGILGSFTTISSIQSWYQYLNKPLFNPPTWIFGPVWTLLYFLMGVSLYLVWIKSKRGRNLYYFWTQLTLNAIWSYLFFGFHSPLLALIDIIALLIMIILTIRVFYRVNRIAGLILLPYFAWVSFATILNFSIWRLN